MSLSSNEIHTDLEAAYLIGRTAEPVVEIDDVEGLLVPKGDGIFEFEVPDVERFKMQPDRKKGLVNVRDVASFIEYVKRHATIATIVTASDQGWMTGILNHHQPAAKTEGEGETDTGDAGWGDHKVILQRPKTPSFKAWTEQNGKELTQEQFGDFLEDRIVDIVEPDGATLFEIASFFTASKNVGFSSARRIDNGQVQLHYSEEIEGGTRRDGTAPLTVPTTFDLVLKPYRDCEAFPISARLRWRLRGQQLFFTFVLSEVLEDKLEEIHDAAIKQVRDEAGVTVLKGAIG